VESPLLRIARRLYHPLKSRALHRVDLKLPFIKQRDGFFIEAGANDGVAQSNTLYLEQVRGWRGLLIEPVPALADMCRVNRSRCIIENAALVARDFEGDTIKMQACGLYSVVQGSLAHETEHLQTGRATQKGVEPAEVEVPARKLSDILDEHNISQIDFFSLDVEGFELQVLKGLDLERHRPDWLLIEGGGIAPIVEYLQPYYDREAKQISPFDTLYKAR